MFRHGEGVLRFYVYILTKCQTPYHKFSSTDQLKNESNQITKSIKRLHAKSLKDNADNENNFAVTRD